MAVSGDDGAVRKIMGGVFKGRTKKKRRKRKSIFIIKEKEKEGKVLR